MAILVGPLRYERVLRDLNVVGLTRLITHSLELCLVVVAKLVEVIDIYFSLVFYPVVIASCFLFAYSSTSPYHVIPIRVV